MCLGIPMMLIEMKDNIGLVESSGIKKEILLDLIFEPKTGDWLLIHAGFAIQRINEEEAQETIKLINEVFREKEIT